MNSYGSTRYQGRSTTNPDFKTQSFASKKQGLLPSSNPPVYEGLGYFVFLPEKPLSQTQVDSIRREEEATRQEQRNQEEAEARKKQEEEHTRKAELEREEERRQRYRALEAAEALRGEEEWVRSGGTLRDAEGNRDFARTNAIREELKLREIESMLVERWQKYERDWADLQGKGKERDFDDDHQVKFEDIPWPVDVGKRVVQLADLTVDGVQDFLLGCLKVRNSKLTKKEIVRASLLRWHPDKMTAILHRVIVEDIDDVKQGISTVMECLQYLNIRV